MEKQKKVKKNNFIFDFAKWTAAIPMIMFFRPKKHYPQGKPKVKGKLIVSSNHVGPLDCVKIAFVFPWRRLWTLTRKEAFETPLANWVFRSINCLPVDRENLSMDTYHDILDLLKRDKLVLFFSEGRVNFHSNDVMEYKMGTVFFAAMSQAPIVPIYIVRQENLWKRLHIIVGKEIQMKDYCSGVPSIADIERLNQIVRDKECELEKWKNEHLGK